MLASTGFCVFSKFIEPAGTSITFNPAINLKPLNPRVFSHTKCQGGVIDYHLLGMPRFVCLAYSIFAHEMLRERDSKYVQICPIRQSLGCVNFPMAGSRNLSRATFCRSSLHQARRRRNYPFFSPAATICLYLQAARRRQ